MTANNEPLPYADPYPPLPMPGKPGHWIITADGRDYVARRLEADGLSAWEATDCLGTHNPQRWSIEKP